MEFASKRLKPLPQTPNHRHTISGIPTNGATNLLPPVETSKQQNKSSLVNLPSPVSNQPTVERSVRINTVVSPKDKSNDKRPTNGFLLTTIDMDDNKETKLPRKEFKEPNVKRLSSTHSNLVNIDNDEIKKREITSSKRSGSNISDDRKDKRISGLVNNVITFGDLEDHKKKDYKDKRLSGHNHTIKKKTEDFDIEDEDD